MKKQSDSRIASVFKRVFNIRQWSDYDRLKAFTQFLGDGIKKMVVPRKADVQNTEETFSEALTELNLTEDDLRARSKGLYRLSMLMCTITFFILSYAVYHLIIGNYKAAIISLVVSRSSLVLAFRYHFWYFQIKERKLGCTIQEWYKYGLLGKKHEKTDP